MKAKGKVRQNIATILLLGCLVSSSALIVSAQEAKKKGGKREPAPVSTAPYDVWTMQELAKPGRLGNFGDYSCSVQRRDVGAAPEAHTNFTHILIFTSGTGAVNLGGEIVAGPDGKKIVQGGDRLKIVVGDVYRMGLNTVHWVIPDAGSSITYFVCNITAAAR
jgi:mannose-6-phosphate isomerase-like protein (cupin superfamily)